MGKIIHGAYDESLAEEIHRIIELLKQMGVQNPTKLEATAIIAEKNKRALMKEIEVKKFISKLRGID